MSAIRNFLTSGGERIRTSDTGKGILAFQASALGHYATPPLWRRYIWNNPLRVKTFTLNLCDTSTEGIIVNIPSKTKTLVFDPLCVTSKKLFLFHSHPQKRAHPLLYRRMRRKNANNPRWLFSSIGSKRIFKKQMRGRVWRGPQRPRKRSNLL